MLGSMFRHIGGLMTNIMLALLIITSADPKGTRARLEGKFDTILESDKQVELYEALRSKGLVEYGSMNAEQREAVLHELTEKFDDADMKRFESSPCDGCLKATYNQKHSGHKRRDAKTRNARRSTEKGHWHCDLMILTGNSKFKRALIMVEERSRFTHISFTTETFNEEEAEYLFEALKETIEANGNEIKSLRWDGESAIWDTAFKKWCNERQIRLDRSASGEQNLAESKIAT